MNTNVSPGDRVRLIRMDADAHALREPGDTGTVTLVDHLGTLHVRWDDGHMLGLIPGADEWEVLDGPTAESDDAALDAATDPADALRRCGVIPLPDEQAGDEPPRWIDTGDGPGWSPDPGTAWERHDDPEQEQP